MSVSAIEYSDLHTVLDGMTGAADVIEATFTPWDADQAGELEGLLREMNALERLDTAVFGHAA